MMSTEYELHTQGAAPEDIPLDGWGSGGASPAQDCSDILAEQRKQRRWDMNYLALASWWANCVSKDPSTKVGSVVVSADGRREYLGYNGFPRGVEDTEERLNDRPTKYGLVVHAEANALLKAGTDAIGGTLYCTLFTCNECAKLVIQSGITRVVCYEEDPARWQDSFEISRLMYAEANVSVEWI